ncbi:MAG TPA: hypothetical protein DCP92_13140 [Nitrospiraceae bacterium]|nr:hypothetical protein [Nitrospiraceae bacterium]
MTLLFVLFLLYAIGANGVRADDGNTIVAAQPNLVNQANAPISSIMQVRLQDAYAPQYKGIHGSGNIFTVALTMPLPEYRLLPFPQLSLLTVPAAVTLPGVSTGFGDVRFVDVAVLHAGPSLIWGVGPAFVFPTASPGTTGQGKWQAGPAAAIGFLPERWLVGVLAQNLISFAGESNRADVNGLILQPFVSYQLGKGWFVRSQPQMLFDWKTGRQLLPIDLGVGRVFKIGRQDVSCFMDPFWNITYDGPAPKYGITFGVTLLYPNFWGAR